jgi:hypothetical protein
LVQELYSKLFLKKNVNKGAIRFFKSGQIKGKIVREKIDTKKN